MQINLYDKRRILFDGGKAKLVLTQ